MEKIITPFKKKLLYHQVNKEKKWKKTKGPYQLPQQADKIDDLIIETYELKIQNRINLPIINFLLWHNKKIKNNIGWLISLLKFRFPEYFSLLSFFFTELEAITTIKYQDLI